MVHRITIELRIGLGGAFVPDRRSLLIFNTFVTYVAGLKVGHLNTFWLPCAYTFYDTISGKFH